MNATAAIVLTLSGISIAVTLWGLYQFVRWVNQELPAPLEENGEWS